MSGWTLTKKLDFHLRIQARSRGGRWCWTPADADQVSPLRRDQEQGGGAGLTEVDFGFCFGCSSAAVLQTLSLSVTLLLRTAVKL